MNQEVYAPNIHLFAYHLRQSSILNKEVDQNYNSKLLWKKYEQILKHFALSPTFELKKAVPPGVRQELWAGATANNILLGLKGHLPNETKQPITGVVCPLQIYDSYALALNLRIPEFYNEGNRSSTVDLEIFRDFNLQKCFLPSHIQSSLGQTILITAWLSPQQEDEHKWREIADNSLKYFLHVSPDVTSEKLPSLYQAGQLFGSPIFEYTYTSEQQGHFLVWLFLTPENADQYTAKADKNLELVYQEFIDIFCYRHKVTKSYQLSREAYQETLSSYQRIQELSQINLPETELTNTELQILQKELRNLPVLDLKYANQIRELNNYQQTIAINNNNYSNKLQQIQAKIPQENLEFLNFFTETIASTYQQQIEKDLGYFQAGYNSIERVISSIRGIIDIEQNKRDRSLERTFQVAAAAFGGGAIVSGVVTQHIDKPFAPINSKNPVHPLVLSLFWSILATIFFGMVAWLLTKSKHKNNKQK